MYRPKGGKASPHWPWTLIGGLGKPDDGTVDGCAVVYSPRSTLYMAATIIPCDIQYATGVVCFVNQRPMTQNNHPTMPPPQPSPPPSPPSLPPTFVNALVQSEQSIFRTLTAAVCKLQSGASLRTTCDVFISGMFPPQNIATTPESPLCGDLYWRSHDLNEPSDKVQNFHCAHSSRGCILLAFLRNIQTPSRCCRGKKWMLDVFEKCLSIGCKCGGAERLCNASATTSKPTPVAVTSAPIHG